MTIKDIAKLSGCGIGTVSRVINNQPGVSDATREKILAVIKESNYEPYVLGRIFAVLEKIQKDSSPSINTTIKDRYIARAASDPVVVFPGLLKLSQSHQRKLSDSSRIYYSNLLNDLMGKLPEQFPKHLTLEEQGSFYLGYYQENQELYRKKSENKEEN